MRQRLGKVERAIKKAYYDGIKANRQAIVNANLNSPKPAIVRYASAGNYEARTHGLYYRGLYDPYMSSVKETRRGFKVPKPKTAKAAKAGPVKHY